MLNKIKTLLHVDMDAFFASVEQLHHPEWKGKSVIVGALPNERGVVSTCSYEARKFGVKSAMASSVAYLKCPDGIFVHPNMKLYKEVSKKAFEVFRAFSPFVESVSIDEAFLDITGVIHLYDDARQLGEKLREKIKEVCGITCSVGIARNRLLAKLASEEKKPDALTILPTKPEEIVSFLKEKPLSVLWGVGRKTLEILAPYGLLTCGDVQKLIPTSPREAWLKHPPPPHSLTHLLGEATAKSLTLAVFGISSDEVSYEQEHEKSVSREHTFAVDEEDRAKARMKLLSLVSEVARRFRKEKRWASTARIKIRTTKFQTFSRQCQFSAPSRDDFSFREAACKLFDELWPQGTTRAIRLIGFGVTNIQDNLTKEQTLFEEQENVIQEKRERLAELFDNLPITTGDFI